LYDEFGGADIISRITNIGHNTILKLHREYLANPEFYLKTGRKKRRNRVTKESFVNKILRKEKDAGYDEYEGNGMDPIEEASSRLTGEAMLAAKEIGESILAKNARGIGIDDELRQ
jgi:hypothetical protein